MSDESGDGRVAVIATTRGQARRRTLPGWARSGLLGLCSGGTLLALLAATGPLVSVEGAAGTSRTQPILLLAALPSLLAVGWTIVRGWRRGMRGVGALLRDALALALVAGALPLSGRWLASGDLAFQLAALQLPGLSVALAAGFAFGSIRHDADGWPSAEDAPRGAGIGCLGTEMFLLAALVIPVIAAGRVVPASTQSSAHTLGAGVLVAMAAALLVGLLVISLFTAPIAGMVGGYLRGEPPMGR
jgi:hypothetical protein